MRYQTLSIGLMAAALTMSLSSAWAQDDRGRPRESEPASRPSSGSTVGSAVPRGSDGGSTSSPSAGSSSPSSNVASPSNPASAPSSWMDGGSPRPAAARAPIRPDRADRLDGAAQRPNNGSSTGDRAVPRGDSGGKASGSTASTNASSGSQSQPAPERGRAVPENSRPRGDHNQTGTAVGRTAPPYGGGGGGGYGYGYGYPVYYPSYIYDPFYSFYYSPYYNRYAYWSPYGYGYGLGYFSYDPYLFGALGYPDYSGYGGGYGVYPEAGGGGGGGGGGGVSSRAYQGAGSLRLKIKPSNAQVYIDGILVGTVDSFDGAFQKLNIDAGPHHVELRAEGYETTSFDVVITPNDTITYKGDMKRR
jgi:PEGA domain